MTDPTMPRNDPEPDVHPAWLDRQAYPFAAHLFPVDEGTIHYVDEGAGPPVVMLHGNPTWSFMYRHLIGHLAPRYRCIAVDYLGFGLSSKPPDWSYRPEAHAEHVHALLDALDLEEVTLVVHDWGGPIGLSYALRHPRRVKQLVILNTWMWPLGEDWRARAFSLMMGGPAGRVLCERFNAFARFVIPLVFGDRSRLSPETHRHYLAPLGRPAQRKGPWVFSRALIDSTAWLRALWAGRRALADKPALLVWGMKDPAFGRVLPRWQRLLPHARVQRLPDVGHYVAEEIGAALGPLVAAFLDETA